MDDTRATGVDGPINLRGIPVTGGIPGTVTTRTYAVSSPWWAHRIRHAAEAVVRWTRRFETHRRIG